jgi:hypothetical protein
MRVFRHNAGFGKRMEYFVISKMLEQGIDVYIPLIDDFAIDAIVRRKDGSFVELQIKARSKDVKFGDAALFAAITHEHRANYYSYSILIEWIKCGYSRQRILLKRLCKIKLEGMWGRDQYGSTAKVKNQKRNIVILDITNTYMRTLTSFNSTIWA